VDKAALGQVFSEYFGFPCANNSTNFSIIIITRVWHNRPLVAAVPSGPNWTPPPTIPIKKKILKTYCVRTPNFTREIIQCVLKVMADFKLLVCCDETRQTHETGFYINKKMRLKLFNYFVKMIFISSPILLRV
jgi:hypothetical protein